MASSLIESQRSRAIRVLRLCSHETGIKGSGGSHGHHQVWARDSMITLIGAHTVDDPVIQAALRASMDTLRRHQSPAGCIPNHVDVVTGKPNFRAYADGGLWYAPVCKEQMTEPTLRRSRTKRRWMASWVASAPITLQRATAKRDGMPS